MIITKEHQEALVIKYFKENKYSKQSIGFIDGMNKILELIENNKTDKTELDRLLAEDFSKFLSEVIEDFTNK